VFHNRGRRLGDWRKRWTKACEDCGLVAGRYGKSYHDLRRTAVRDMVRAGVPQSIAKVVSGHRSDSIFQRYDIVNTRDQSEALQRVEDHRRVLEERERAQKGAHT
jgi:hypothetical protein